MSFGTEINAIMLADPSINSLIDGSIYYVNLPKAFPLDKNWLLYWFRRGEQVNSMNKADIYKIYDLTTQVYTPNKNNDLDLLSERLPEYFNNKSGGNIIDILFETDDYAFDQEKQVYANTLEFKCIYGD